MLFVRLKRINTKAAESESCSLWGLGAREPYTQGSEDGQPLGSSRASQGWGGCSTLGHVLAFRLSKHSSNLALFTSPWSVLWENLEKPNSLFHRGASGDVI